MADSQPVSDTPDQSTGDALAAATDAVATDVEGGVDALLKDLAARVEALEKKHSNLFLDFENFVKDHVSGLFRQYNMSGKPIRGDQ